MNANYNQNKSVSNQLSKEVFDILKVARFSPKPDPKKFIESVPNGERNKIEVIEEELREQSYDIVKYAGKGMFGLTVIVKQCRDEEGKSVEVRQAVKCIGITNQFGKEDKKIIQEVEIEIDNHKKCKSEYVVGYLSSFKSKYFYYIFMEECQGTLQELFESHQNTFNENTFIKYGLDILMGIKDCHCSQVIIRDIKPENILINYQNKAKLSDFGLARQLDLGVSTLNNSIKGNLTFSSPESLQNISTDIKLQIQRVFQEKSQLKQTKQTELPSASQGVRSDLYSIGQVLLQMLGGTIFDIARKQMGDLDCGYIPPQKQLFNRNKIQKIIKGLNEYLPKDRLSVDEALILFSDLDFVDSKSNNPLKLHYLLNPSTMQKGELQDSVSYTLIENQQYIPVIESDQKNKLNSLNYSLCSQIEDYVQELIKQYNPKRIPLSKMLIIYNYYSLTGLQFILVDEEDIQKNNLSSFIVTKNGVIPITNYNNNYFNQKEQMNINTKSIYLDLLDIHYCSGRFLSSGRVGINFSCNQQITTDYSNSKLYDKLVQVIIPILQEQSKRDGISLDINQFLNCINDPYN